MADNNLNLPPIVNAPGTPSTPSDPLPGRTEIPNLPPDDANGKTYMIGGGIVIVLAILLLLFKRAYANYLIGKKRSPNQSDSASWALFGMLFFPVLAVGLGYVKGTDSLMTLPYLVPLVVGMLICLVLTFMLSAKK